MADMPLSLRNRGVSCYVNAALQAVMHVPKIANYHLWGLGERDGGMSAVLGKAISMAWSGGNGADGRSLWDCQEILEMLPMSRSPSSTMGDSHEALCQVIDLLSASGSPYGSEYLAEETDPHAIECWKTDTCGRTDVYEDTFRGVIAKTIRCGGCLATVGPQHRFETFTFLPLAFDESGGNHLPSMIAAFFREEVVDGSGECGRCSGKRVLVRSEPRYVPRALVVQLMRFDGLGNKISSPVTGSLEDVDIHGLSYELRSFVVHVGADTRSGHYFTCGRHKGEWTLLDDERCQKLPERDVHGIASSGYYYIYNRKSPAPGCGGGATRKRSRE